MDDPKTTTELTPDEKRRVMAAVQRYRDRKPLPENEDVWIAPALNEERPTDDITVLELSGFDLDMVRQWFNAVQDTAPRYLEQRDYELAARVHQALALPIPRSVARHLEGAGSHG